MNQTAVQTTDQSFHGEQVILAAIKKHLAFLISQDTCNPPREIQFTDPIFVELEAFFKATGFTVTMADFGDGHVAFYAVRGKPDVLFNVHLDTVPVSSGWQHDPFSLTEVDERFYGRGVCDIKGAAACLMALAESNSQNMAVLFTTDEEGANNCCIQHFIDGHDLSVYKQVIVAEPTQCLAITEHRGYVSAHAVFNGQSGHSSSVNALTGNAVHQANHWLHTALQQAHKLQTTENPAGICFNLGYIKGGEKNNMIAEQCQLGFSIRVPAGSSSLQAYQSLIQSGQVAEWHCSMLAPALPESPDASQKAIEFCEANGIEQGPAVDFWTEAALFSQAGIPALVLGPGDIAQAHTVDEWVTKEQLLKCYQIYAEVLS
ncbi:MAG: acetylornithine deacetylase [Marinicella sp.]